MNKTLMRTAIFALATAAPIFVSDDRHKFHADFISLCQDYLIVDLFITGEAKSLNVSRRT